MASPVDSPPAVERSDAERLLAALKSRASDAETARRERSASERMARAASVKTVPQPEKPAKK